MQTALSALRVCARLHRDDPSLARGMDLPAPSDTGDFYFEGHRLAPDTQSRSTNLSATGAGGPKKDEDDLQILPWISHPPPPLTEAAIDQRLRRIMKPRRNGEYVVGKDFIEMWEDKHAGGRDRVRSLFEKAAYEPDRGVFK